MNNSTDDHHQRLLDPQQIPITLWNTKEQLLHLPPLLATAYKNVLVQHGLEDLAQSRDPNNPPVGGITKEQTDIHFAQAFDGSAARAQLAVLDPQSDVPPTSDTFISKLSGNSLCLTDAPCGAGAASLAFLCTIHELRSHGILPREPLEVCVIGAEISEHARGYARELFEHVAPLLEDQAIFMTPLFMTWDATNKQSNVDLIRKMIELSATKECRLVVVANFSNFLIKQRKFKSAKPQLQALFEFASGENSEAVWIEPCTNTATKDGGMFSLVRGLIKAISPFAREKCSIEGEATSTSSVAFSSPVLLDKTHAVRLAVMSIDLGRPE